MCTLSLKEGTIFQIKPGKETAGIYALDLALDQVDYVRKKKDIMGKDPNSKYYIITLTDGLDNVSNIVAKNNKQGNYDSVEDYIAKMQEKMQKTAGKCDLTSYCLAYIGEDLKKTQVQNNQTDESFRNYLKKSLEVFTGASNGNKRPEVILGDDFDKILEDFTNQFKAASFDFYIPKGYNNKKIRLILEDKHSNKITVEGDFTKKYQLTNLKFSEGVTCDQTAGSSLEPTNKGNKKEIRSTFSLENLRYNDKPFSVWKCTQDHLSNGLWINNSEYNMKTGMHKNAYIIILLDSSQSFGSQSNNARSMIMNIINEITK